MENRLPRLIGVGLIFAGTFVNPGCVERTVPSITPQATSSPTGESKPPVKFSLEGWRNESSFSRIQQLERKMYPLFAEFDSTKELILATAQFYCQQTKCKISAKEMAENIYFVSPDRFIEEAKKDRGRDFTQAEEKEELETRVEMVNQKTKQSFVNNDLLKKVIKRAKQDSPNEVAVLQQRGIDFEAVYIKSMLFHVYAHMVQQENEYKFAPFSMQVSTKTEGIIKVPYIGKLQGFTFVGENEKGKPFYINGGKEAIAERDAQIVGSRSGTYITVSPFYADGADLVAQLNRMSGISDNEFLALAHGEKDVSIMFEKWATLRDRGNLDKRAGVLALAAVGLQIDFEASKERMLEAVAKFAGIRLR